MPEKIAIISDVHSNLHALEAVLKDIRQKDCKTILFAGDVVGYGAFPNECCEKLQEACKIIIQGNHDANLDFKRLDWFNPDAQEALRWTEARLTRPLKSWLLGLPKEWQGEIAGRKIYMTHGSPDDPLYAYVMPNTDPKLFGRWLNEKRANVLIMGHTHIPFVRKLTQGLIVNAGSVGQPRDGDPRACWIELDLEKLDAEIHRVGYAVERAAEEIQKQGLPKFLAERLFEGI